MKRKHLFFVLLALAVSANRFALSTSRAGENAHVVDTLDEERLEESIRLFGKTIPVPIQVPVPVPEQVPEAVAQLASHGNIRNGLAVDSETMQQRVTNALLGTQPGQPSSAQGKHPSTMTEAGPSDPTAAKNVDHSLRGVKTKASSRDEVQRLQIQEASRKVQKRRRNGVVYKLSDLIGMWGIDSEQILQRKIEFYNHGIPEELFPEEGHLVDCMAVGSIYFERTLSRPIRRVKRQRKRLENRVDALDSRLLEQLHVDRAKVKNLAFYMYRNELKQPATSDIVYMAVGREFYRSLHPGEVSS